MSSIVDAVAEYERALKLGKKEGTPVPSLDEILEEKNEQIVGEISLGLIQIPTDRIVGTKTDGRSGALSKSFYPLLEQGTEFAVKWEHLYVAHLDEGIREPIKAYEYMNEFYVLEGNKRVSVLRYCGAVSIPGVVIRLVPKRTNDPEKVVYYEFMEFYALSGVNYIYFTKPGSFARLQRLVGKRPDEMWSDVDKLDFSSVFTSFSAEYEAKKKKGMPVSSSDAFLFFIGVYDYQSVLKMTSSELKEKIEQAWEEFFLLTGEEPLQLQMTPAAVEPKKSVTKLISNLLGGTRQKVAFIHQKTTETSGWTYAHELGRLHLEEVFPDDIYTQSYFMATEDNCEQILQEAIRDGCTIVFTTAPPLLKASLKVAIEHPEIKILNCSLNTSHKHIRTYYARMYEAKFLMGAIAGAMAANDKIGYVADYPIYGMTANINAFALGAKMVNPRAKIYLEWSTMKGINLAERFEERGISVISGLDILPTDVVSRNFGLYCTTDKSFRNLAMPVWHWGKFYEKMIGSILNGTWKSDETANDKGLNYWWGMSSEIIEVICSHHLPIGTARLVDLLKQTICAGDFNPFSGILYSQDGAVSIDPDYVMTPEEIIRMDWLAENVVGLIPKMEELADSAKAVVTKSGLDKPSDDATIV